jgi:hypothetical protein
MSKLEEVWWGWLALNMHDRARFLHLFREAYRQENNRPVRWPIYATAGLLAVVALPALRRRLRKEQG